MDDPFPYDVEVDEVVHAVKPAPLWPLVVVFALLVALAVTCVWYGV